MAFGNNTDNKQNENQEQVDWEAYNKYILETCDLEEEEVVVGVVSGIQDLGMQPQEDAEIELPKEPAQEEQDAAIAEFPDTYFEEKGGKWYKRFPSKPQHCVNITVDFPDIMVDRGQFFGESNEAPLRLSMGGKFYTKANGNILGRKFTLRQRNDATTNNQWSLPFNNTLYKMALDSGIVKKGEPFTKFRIDEIIGKSFQFKVQVFMKESKGKHYLNESIKYVGKLGRKDEPLELEEKYQHLVHFQMDNEESAIKQLRSEVINTIKLAQDFKGSKLESQLIKAGKIQGESKDPDDTPEAPEKPQKKTSKKSSTKAPVKEEKPVEAPTEPSVDFDDTIPF